MASPRSPCYWPDGRGESGKPSGFGSNACEIPNRDNRYALASPLARLEPYGMLILIGLLFILPMLGVKSDGAIKLPLSGFNF